MSRHHMVRVRRDETAGGRTIGFSPKLAAGAGMRNGDAVSVSFGVRKIAAVVRVRRDSDDIATVTLSGTLGRDLGCPSGIDLHIRATEGVVRLGPLLGIFAPKFGPGRFGAHTPYIRALVRYARRMGVWAYVFTSGDVNLETSSTHGYYLVNGAWHSADFPLPDVCYDRIPSRRIDAQPRVRDVKQQLRRTPGVLCFNDRFMDKWRVHTELSRSPVADEYLPRTVKYEGEAELRLMLSRFRRVFVKPAGGSQGNGIVKVVRNGPDTFSYVVAGRGRGSCRGFADLARRVSRIAGSRRYIVQQGLALATVGGRHFDVRLLMQKESPSKWLFTKVYARVAAPGRITSNISTGAEGTGLSAVLHQAFGRRAGSIGEKVRQAGRRLAPEVEKALGGNFGELGLDLGVDSTGRVWLIEVNSKPFRHMTTETGSRLEIVRSVVRPLSYTLSISGFHRGKGDMLEGTAPVEDDDDSESADGSEFADGESADGQHQQL